ncbi:leucyl/phenylalanyl-tRNA--protein transferase [Pseudoalteromonas xiamenensis]|uniref:leucyl/phenylalanyl-tRNA--protein transferase n=1 Tax=Pseudoalteromonas xiamenensis TaxID=882626 RepID=UPI0035EB9DF6
MSQQLVILSHSNITFPSPSQALTDPDGLLAIGGDLSIDRLKAAYSHGIFPWFNDEEPILWWSPSQRGVIELDDFHVSKSTKKTYRKLRLEVSVNKAFSQVIEACRAQRLDKEGTWINPDMIAAYQLAHKAGIAHSLEIWLEGRLVGGLYGIMQNGVFCGESMFYNITDASKIAMWQLVLWLKRHNAHFIDCQLLNPYLATLGAKSISREEFLTKLKAARNYNVPNTMWQPQSLGEIYD